MIKHEEPQQSKRVNDGRQGRMGFDEAKTKFENRTCTVGL